MTYQEMEEQVNQNTNDISTIQDGIDNSVGGIGGLSLPLDINTQKIIDEETINFLASRMGIATLVAGTITVLNSVVSPLSNILISRKTTGGTLGYLSITQSTGSFTINSSSATDTSVITYLII